MLISRLSSMVSSSRYGIAEAMGMLSDRELAGVLSSEEEPGCADGDACRVG